VLFQKEERDPVTRLPSDPKVGHRTSDDENIRATALEPRH
jgi:hypothetical protein